MRWRRRSWRLWGDLTCSIEVNQKVLGLDSGGFVMSEYDLIPETIYENLPQDDHEKFVILVREAQANLARLLDDRSSNEFADEIRSQFVSTISGVAEALGVLGLPDISDDITNYKKYQTFQVYLASIVAKVRLQSQLVSRPYSVALGRITRAKIQQEIDQLRHSIGDSVLPETKQKALLDKLAELEIELSQQRLSFARTMAIAASIMTIVGGGTAALANFPKAAETVAGIIRLIGEDKANEEAERLRLMPPPKALPNHTKSNIARPSAFDSDLDDDVPF